MSVRLSSVGAVVVLLLLLQTSSRIILSHQLIEGVQGLWHIKRYDHTDLKTSVPIIFGDEVITLGRCHIKIEPDHSPSGWSYASPISPGTCIA